MPIGDVQLEIVQLQQQHDQCWQKRAVETLM